MLNHYAVARENRSGDMILSFAPVLQRANVARPDSSVGLPQVNKVTVLAATILQFGVIELNLKK